jgi:hypothetical protein
MFQKRELEEKYNAMRIEMEQQQPPSTTHNDKRKLDFVGYDF